MSEASSSPKRARLDFDDGIKEEQFEKFKSRDQDDSSSVQSSSSKSRKRGDLDDEGKEEDGKLKNANRESTPREHTLVMRLTNKEQELQECMNQIQEMKQAQTQKTAHLRSMLLDPAINLVFQRMAKEMDEHKEKLKQKQNELSAWKFTPDSQTGMRLMAKCRMLLQENGDLGKMISSGRTARLEGEISLHKALVTEMKKNQKELDEFVGELEEDVEGMQGMIFMLQDQLKEAREQIARLQQENEQLRTLRMPPDPEPGGEGSNPSSDPHSTTAANTNAEPSAATPPPTLTADGSEARTTAPHHLAQSSDNDVASACSTFASKVIPDSGMLTQEDEEVSMDTTDLAAAGSPPSGPAWQPPVSSSDRTSSSSDPPSHSLKQAESPLTSTEPAADASSRQKSSNNDATESPSLPPSASSPDSSCRGSVLAPPALTSAPCDENPGDASFPSSHPLCSVNGKVSDVHAAGDTEHKEDSSANSGGDGRTIHAAECRDSDGHNDKEYCNVTSAGLKDRTEVEGCKQSLHTNLGLTLSSGKAAEDDPTTDSQVKENLVNGTTMGL